MPSNIGPTENHAFYGDGTTTTATGTDQTGQQSTTVVSPGDSFHFNLAHGLPCTIMVDARIRPGLSPAGYLFSRYSGQTELGIRYNVSSVQFLINNSVAQTIDITTGIGTYNLVVHWSIAESPITGGRVLCSARIWNGSAGAYIGGLDWENTAPTPAGMDVIFGAQTTGGANSTEADIQGAGFLLHATHPQQVYRDRVSAAAAPTLESVSPIELPYPSLLPSFGRQGSLAGPTHWIAAQAHERNAKLCASPLVSRLYQDPARIAWDGLPTNTMAALAADNLTYYLLPLTFRRPVSEQWNRCKARIHWRGGSLTGSTTETIRVSFWSASANPGLQEPDTEIRGDALVYSGAGAQDVSPAGPGRCSVFDDIPIVRTPDGQHTWLAFSFGISGAAASSSVLYIDAISVEPMEIENTDDAIAGGFGA